MKTTLISSPIDFIIGVRIPVRLITPSFIRKCKREKVPAIFVELEDLDELEDIPWGWVRDALFPLQLSVYSNNYFLPKEGSQEGFVEMERYHAKWKNSSSLRGNRRKSTLIRNPAKQNRFCG